MSFKTNDSSKFNSKTHNKLKDQKTADSSIRNFMSQYHVNKIGASVHAHNIHMQFVSTYLLSSEQSVKGKCR